VKRIDIIFIIGAERARVATGGEIGILAFR
jgi:hypothetical protein